MARCGWGRTQGPRIHGELQHQIVDTTLASGMILLTFDIYQAEKDAVLAFDNLVVMAP
ncbi:MAG: hypothetical protein JW750_09290 [Anaerolineaceae bacterium]|nr:hypothetical protein [Anaerolineaceae bacterium]